jgi:hypothetical protein
VKPGGLDAIILSHFIHPRNAVNLPERTQKNTPTHRTAGVS